MLIKVVVFEILLLKWLIWVFRYLCLKFFCVLCRDRVIIFLELNLFFWVLWVMILDGNVVRVIGWLIGLVVRIRRCFILL